MDARVAHRFQGWGMNTVTDKRDSVAHMQIKISITGLPQLSQVLTRIAQIPNVISARRKK